MLRWCAWEAAAILCTGRFCTALTGAPARYYAHLSSRSRDGGDRVDILAISNEQGLSSAIHPWSLPGQNRSFNDVFQMGCVQVAVIAKVMASDASRCAP